MPDILPNPCNPGNPFVNLGADHAAAPVLNYLMPQETCFNVNAYFDLDIPADSFKPAYRDAPAKTIFDELVGKSYNEIVAALLDEIKTGTNKLLMNARVVQRNPKVFRTLDSIAPEMAPASVQNSQVATQISVPIANPNASLRAERTSDHVVLTSTPMMEKPKPMPPVMAMERQSPENIVIANQTLAQIARKVSEGYIPKLKKMFSGKTIVEYRTRPEPRPRLIVVEHYKVCNYLGNYGAGRIVKTFSLLPGERTTIAIKSYKDQSSSRSKTSSSSFTSQDSSTEQSASSSSASSMSERAENVLDSFSESSAERLEELIQEQTGSETYANSSQNVATGTSNGTTSGFEIGGSGAVNLLNLVQAGAGASGAFSQENNSYMGSESAVSRGEVVSSLTNAIDSHVAESSRNRTMEVNTTTRSGEQSSTNSSNAQSVSSSTSQTINESESLTLEGKTVDENLVTRELQNINMSRTLNFVFRQLQQEYVSITFLNEVSILFSNGFPELDKLAKLGDVDRLLNEILVDTTAVDAAKTALGYHLCNILDWEGNKVPFAEAVVDAAIDNCLTADGGKTHSYWRKIAGLSDTYPTDEPTYTVPGIILNVKHRVLPTDSVIVDALLGQGEALDCYNKNMQSAATHSANLDNLMKEEEVNKVKKGIEVVEAQTTPAEKADAFKKIFGTCCEPETP